MKMKIAILGSTGSIGKSTLDVIRKDKKNFEIVFLSANNNYKKLIHQAKEFNVENVLIKNKNFYIELKTYFRILRCWKQEGGVLGFLTCLAVKC